MRKLRYTQRVTAVLAPNTAEQLAGIAEKKGVSTSHLVRDCVEQQIGQLHSEERQKSQAVST